MGHRSPHKGDVSPRGLQEPARERSCRETGLDMRSRSKNQLHIWVIQASFMPLYLPACVPAKSIQSDMTEGISSHMQDMINWFYLLKNIRLHLNFSKLSFPHKVF